MRLGNRFENKRGQASVFIIIGVVILFLAFFIGYLQNENFRQRVQSGLFGASVVPEQAKGVVSYLDECIEEIARDGLSILGSQGGYIEIPDYVANNPRVYLDVAGVKIPYWVYGEDNINIPTREEMEFELKKNIEKRFEDYCDLDQFEDRGYIFSTSKIEVDVGISDKEVRVKLDSDFDVEIKEKKYALGDYVLVSLDVALGKLWEISRDFIERELKNKPLEWNTLNLIGAYSQEKDYFPPIAGFDFKCGGRSWSLSDVRERFKGFTSSYVPYLRVKGSENEKDLEDDFYKTMVLNKVSDVYMGDVGISFSYFSDWPLFFDVYPRDGGMLKAGGFNYNAPFFGLLCNNLYNFRYTVLYPVLVTLEDERGYRFNFPIEVYLRDNYGRDSLFGDDTVDSGVGEVERSLFCDEDQKLSGEVDLLVRDGLSSENLDGVGVSYICGFNKCGMGESEEGLFREKFPLCKGGELRLEKEGYLVYRERLDTGVSLSMSKVVELEPFRTKVVSVKVFDVDEEGEVLGERELREDEEVILELTKVNADLLGYDLQKVLTLKGREKGVVEIVPGDYAINAQLKLNKVIVLPREEIEGSLFEGSELDGALTGGIKVDDYYLEKGVLDSNEEIVIYVVSYGEPGSVREVDRGFDLEGFDFEPRLK